MADAGESVETDAASTLEDGERVLLGPIMGAVENVHNINGVSGEEREEGIDHA